MTGGTITGNSAGHDGGGVYVKNGSFTMTGGSITENTAGSGCNGGGVYADINANVTLSGAPVITENKDADGTVNNVYLDKDEVYGEGGTFIGEGGLSSTSSIGVTVDADRMPTTDGGYTTIAEAAEGYTITADDAKRVSADAGTGYSVRQKDNALVLVKGELPHEHPICGEVCGHTGGTHADADWTAWDGVSDIVYDANNTAYVYLTGDAERDTTLTVEKGYTLYLCLNGYSLTMKAEGEVISVTGSFTLTDCRGGDDTKPYGKITHAAGVDGRGVSITSAADASLSETAVFTMYGGEISGNKVSDSGSINYGGGVRVSDPYSTFTMLGGIITNNEATNGGGGGVYIGGGRFEMSGSAVITRNKTASSLGGGGVFMNGSDTVYALNEFIMSGNAVISENTATNGNGGGVYMNSAPEVTMNGGSITGNTAANNGGGVYAFSGTFTMNDGTIAGNKATAKNGGGVYANGSTVFTVKDGTIGGSTAADANAAKYGGGVYVKNGTFTMSGGKITGNSATKDGGGVRLDKGTLNMSGSAVISRNTTDTYGGGVDVNNGSFTMSGGSITGNNAAGDSPNWSGGGGVFVYDGGSFTMSGGSITGNNAIRGGGVELTGINNTMTVSGSVQIMNNWRKGTLNSASGVYEKGSSGKPENLYLYSGKTVAIGTDGLNADAHIGISTEDWPDPGSPVKIATNATNEESHYTAIFTPDAEEADYKITKKNDNALYLSAHEHTWMYTADAATHTITAKCSECQQTGGSVTLQAPDESTLTYDGNGKAATVTASSNWQGPTVSGITIGYTYEVNGHPTMLSPGEAPINARAYTASITLGGKEVSVQYTINKAELTIKANDNTIVYGDTASDKGVTYSGFVNGENESVLGGELTYTFSYTLGSDTGLYIIMPEGKTSGNYEIKTVPGTLTVTPREVTLTWHNYENRTYGDGGAVTATAGNLVNGDEVEVTVRDGGWNMAGSWIARAEGLTGDKADNYKLPENATKEYTIGLAEQKLTFAKTGDQSVTYGETLENPATNKSAGGGEVTYSSSDPNVATVDENGTVTARNVGTTTISASAAAVDGKYTEAKATYQLTVTARPIFLTITPVTYYYGQPGVSFTPLLRTVSGSLAEGDDYKTLKLSWSSVGTMWKAGTFDVNATSYNSNYNVTFDGTGKLIVLPRPITVTVDAASRVYGEANPTFAAQQTGGMGFVNGETVASLGLSLSSTATATSPVGSYDVTGTASNGNYAVKVEGTDALTITAKAITVTVNEATRPYGEANPTFTAAAPSSALVGEDAIESLGLSLSAPTATTTSDVGKYDVTGSANNRNYEVTIDGANKLTVTKKELTANDLEFTDTPITKVYDGKTDAAVTVQIKDSAKVKAEDVLPDVTGIGTYNSKDVKDASMVTFVTAETESRNYILPAGLTKEHAGNITKRVISIKSVTTAPKQYDRNTNAWSCITDVSFDNLVSGETLTKSGIYNGSYVVGDYGINEATFNSADVELANTITGVVGITNPNLNYTFADETGSETSRASFTTTGKINKANGGTLDPVELTIRCTNRDEKNYTIDQSKLPGGQIWTFSTSAAATGKAALSTNTIGANTGVLTYQLSDGAAGDTVTWTVTITCGNYDDYTLTITLKLIARDEQTGFKFENNTTSVTKTYGDEDFTIAASGGATGSSVTYTSSDETVAKVDEDGKVTIVGAGITTIKAKASETADFEEKEISYTLTVKPKTLAKDDLTYSGSITKVYDGSTNAPSGLTVSVDPSSLVNGDTLTVNGTLKFNSANVGEASEITFIPTAITTGNYTLAATEALTIRSASITAKEVTLTSGINATNRSYAKDNKTVALTKGTLAFTGLVSGETLDVNIPDTGTIFDTKVGTYNVTYSGVTLKDGTTGKASNYKLVGSLPTVTVTISKAAAPVLADIPVSFKYTVTTGEKAIGSVMPADAGALTYTKGTESKTGSVTVTDWNVDPTGKVTYTLSSGAAGNTVTLPVTIGSDNYADATVNVVITLTAKDDQAALTLTGGTTVVYGQTLQLGTSGGTGTGAVTYAVTNGTGEATIDAATGKLTPVKVGTVKVTATKAGDASYNSITSAEVEITITRATPTGAPKYTAITTIGKTLADAGLTTAGSNLSVPGTVKWVDDTGADLPATTTVEANKLYKWVFTPADSANYTTLTGSIELYHKSSSSGSGWYYTYYTIKATAGTNGSIAPSGWTSVRDGRDQTFTITPDKGYAVAKVLVDGKSVGAVKSYTFKNVTKDHTIEAIFMKSNGNPQTGVFVDVAEGSYYEEAIDWAVEKGITNGVSSNMFAPNDPCTRAQIVTFLWRAAGSPAPKSMSSFTDVPADAFYAKAVAWAVENGITSGTGESKFSPNSTCTRAQAVTFLYRASGSPAVSGKAEFSDVSTTAFYADAVAWAAKKGITTGIGGGLFGSDNDCTRGQIVTFLWRAMAE